MTDREAKRPVLPLRDPIPDGTVLPEDEAMMALALREAEAASDGGDVPVGAVVVYRGEVIASAHNRREADRMATAHAELLAIEEACRRRGGWRLFGCTLYVTLEPCAMCAGAVVNARLDRVVFAARDRRFGAFGSLFDLTALPLNHRPSLTGGVKEEEAAARLTAFFKAKRTLPPGDI